VKHLLSDSNLLRLGLTYAIVLLHIVFDYLAFKNDIGFWRGRKVGEPNNEVPLSPICASHACTCCEPRIRTARSLTHLNLRLPIDGRTWPGCHVARSSSTFCAASLFSSIWSTRTGPAVSS
jgi:hypothetical protein